MTVKLRIGMAQMLVEGAQPAANLDRAEAFIRDAASRGCRLVVLPECMDLGWTDPSARRLAQPIPGRTRSGSRNPPDRLASLLSLVSSSAPATGFTMRPC